MGHNQSSMAGRAGPLAALPVLGPAGWPTVRQRHCQAGVTVTVRLVSCLGSALAALGSNPAVTGLSRCGAAGGVTYCCPSAKIHVDAREIHVDARASDVMRCWSSA